MNSVAMRTLRDAIWRARLEVYDLRFETPPGFPNPTRDALAEAADSLLQAYRLLHVAGEEMDDA